MQQFFIFPWTKTKILPSGSLKKPVGSSRGGATRNSQGVWGAQPRRMQGVWGAQPPRCGYAFYPIQGFVYEFDAFVINLIITYLIL